MSELKFSKKHKIKEDHFIERVFEIGHSAKQHSRHLSTVGIALLVVLLIGFFAFKSSQSKTLRAQESFGSAMIAYEKGDMAQAASNFTSTLTRYKKTSQAAMSSFMLGSIYYNQKDYGQARTYFNRTVKDYSQYGFLKGAGLRGLINCAVQEKNYAEAAKLSDRFLKECSGHYLAPEVLLTLGDCQQKLGNAQKAKEAYERIVKEYPQSVQNTTARNLLATLS